MSPVSSAFSGLREYARAMKCAPVDVRVEMARLVEAHRVAVWERCLAKWASKHAR